MIIALLFGFGPIVISSWGSVLHRFDDTPLVTEGIAEIDRALGDHLGLRDAVGPGAGLGSFDGHVLRVIPVFRGNPFPIDSFSWMAPEVNGVSDEVVRRAVRECRVDLWLLPTGAPFVAISHLDGKNVFSAKVCRL